MKHRAVEVYIGGVYAFWLDAKYSTKSERSTAVPATFLHREVLWGNESTACRFCDSVRRLAQSTEAMRNSAQRFE